LAQENQICLAEKCFDWNIKAVMIKNYPNLAFEIFKTNLKTNFLSRKGHLRNLNTISSFCTQDQLLDLYERA